MAAATVGRIAADESVAVGSMWDSGLLVTVIRGLKEGMEVGGTTVTVEVADSSIVLVAVGTEDDSGIEHARLVIKKTVTRIDPGINLFIFPPVKKTGKPGLRLDSIHNGSTSENVELVRLY